MQAELAEVMEAVSESPLLRPVLENWRLIDLPDCWLVAGALGIFASTIGLDPEASTPRMTFDVLDLEEGIPLLAMVIGIFMHVSTTILFESSEDHHYNRRKGIAILLGAGLAALGVLIPLHAH